MELDRYNDLQRLSISPVANIKPIRECLREAKTLIIEPHQGSAIYPASGSLQEGHSSGYQYAWLRDNVMITHSKWFCGTPEDRQGALKTVRALQRFLQSQIPRFQNIIATPALKEDIKFRPHVRFNAETLQELPGEWSHAQNDSLGAVVWLRFLMANADLLDTSFQITEEEWPLYQRIVEYLGAIQFWSDADSGAWEEVRKLNTSSVGAVLAGLREIVRYGDKVPDRKAKALAQLAAKLYQNGLPVLQQLPFESFPARKSDAALLLLIFPYAVVTDPAKQHQILSLVRARLMGPSGIRRYVGDSYYCQDYEQWFDPQSRSADFSRNIEFRDELLVPGLEAQWCLFDPLMSAIYGLKSSPDSAMQILHFQRSVRQLTAKLQCPELYYSCKGRYVPNDHTPLGWTQANLAIALEVLERPNDPTLKSISGLSHVEND